MLALRLLALVAAATALVVPAAAGAAKAKPSAPQRIARTLVHNGAAGALVVVDAGGRRRVGVAGVAERRPRRAMTAPLAFRIASVTKSMVATVVLQLVDEGTLTLGDTVERWLPGVLANGKSVTLRQLLNHTSGVYNYTDDRGFVDAVLEAPSRAWPTLELVAIANAHDPVFAPGASWAYSNTNYLLLGLVVERVTGRSLAVELQERLFGPLGMTRSALLADVSIPFPHAHGYDGRVDLTGVFSPGWAGAAGAVVSTAGDLVLFFRALLGGRLLSSASLAEARRTVLVTPSASFGLGIVRFRTRCGASWGHTGHIPGYRTSVLASPNGRRVAVVFVNTEVTPSDAAVAAAGENAYCAR